MSSLRITAVMMTLKGLPRPCRAAAYGLDDGIGLERHHPGHVQTAPHGGPTGLDMAQA
jgi:hypothetical protein